jgi:hypothetical protein
MTTFVAFFIVQKLAGAIEMSAMTAGRVHDTKARNANLCLAVRHSQSLSDHRLTTVL